MQNGMAIVTGAARGLGREIALTLAAAGRAVAATDINAEAATATAAAITAQGGQAIGLQLDVRDSGAIETIFVTAEQALAPPPRLSITPESIPTTHCSICRKPSGTR